MDFPIGSYAELIANNKSRYKLKILRHEVEQPLRVYAVVTEVLEGNRTLTVGTTGYCPISHLRPFHPPSPDDAFIGSLYNAGNDRPAEENDRDHLP